jgi:cation:H+ antiporter
MQWKLQCLQILFVAFGTSFPEFVTSMVAAWQDKIDLAIGNIVGSNIANICLILGISGIIIPITIDPTTVKKELYWMMAASILFWIFGLGGTINHLEGAVLFAGIFAFTLIMIRNDEESLTREWEKLHKLPVSVRFSIYLAMTVGGIILLMFGSNWLIESATNIARALGVSDVVIGLSLVAFGTSLPELATAIIAIVRKENEILLGNIVGSNIFNILFVGGVLTTFFTAPINQRIISFDLPVMLIVSLFLTLVVIKRKKISHLTGSFLFTIYILYIIFIFLNQA